jgi:acyl carrier protein
MVLIAVLEEKYKINIPSDTYESFSTISSIIDLIYSLVEK